MTDKILCVAVKSARYIFGEGENKVLIEFLKEVIFQLVSRHLCKLFYDRYVIFDRILLVCIFFFYVAFNEL